MMGLVEDAGEEVEVEADADADPGADIYLCVSPAYTLSSVSVWSSNRSSFYLFVSLVFLFSFCSMNDGSPALRKRITDIRGMEV